MKMTDMKNTAIEVKIVIDSLISRLNRAKEIISELGNIQTERKRKKEKS